MIFAKFCRFQFLAHFRFNLTKFNFEWQQASFFNLSQLTLIKNWLSQLELSQLIQTWFEIILVTGGISKKKNIFKTCLATSTYR